ncbi:MAG TPA: substrate-binding domain-containing protein [Candidatus Margulisiibacteriota bacterium]|nr:substrate-binding domain-containing protein [Candidatus Margulisiibacteriota bacterium]
MSVPHAVMGVLARGERYGYELRRGLEEELGPDWRLDFGQLYRALGTMTDKGWISFRVEAGRGGPQRKVYTLTAAGRREMERWLRVEANPPARRRDAAMVRARVAAKFGGRQRAGEEALFAVGSDDLVLDLLARRLAHEHPQVRFAARAVGSLSGLIALHEQRAHLAGIHLLDAESGEYNVPYVKHFLPEERVVVINVAWREQGLLLAAGNPKHIRGLRDLTRRDVQIMNRQAGAGTRLLLRQLLRKARIDPTRIRGYERDLTTHGAVAGAIAAGAADAGVGLRAAAQLYGLDFLPLAKERYDLVMPRRVFESRPLRPLLELMHDAAFRREAAQFAGYDLARMSQMVAAVG